MLVQQDALGDNINVVRVVFHEITETAIKNALKSPRDIDSNLVNAYLARRALDYLIGFNISPLLWRKLPGCQSAGRVQSAALALICDRELEIDLFKPREYWTVEVDFKTMGSSHSICSQLTYLDAKKLDQLSIESSNEAETMKKKISLSKYMVMTSKTSKIQRNPPMPYITSSLQQDAASKLHFPAAYTMKVYYSHMVLESCAYQNFLHFLNLSNLSNFLVKFLYFLAKFSKLCLLFGVMNRTFVMLILIQAGIYIDCNGDYLLIFIPFSIRIIFPCACDILMKIKFIHHWCFMIQCILGT